MAGWVGLVGKTAPPRTGKLSSEEICGWGKSEGRLMLVGWGLEYCPRAAEATVESFTVLVAGRHFIFMPNPVGINWWRRKGALLKRGKERGVCCAKETARRHQTFVSVCNLIMWGRPKIRLARLRQPLNRYHCHLPAVTCGLCRVNIIGCHRLYNSFLCANLVLYIEKYVNVWAIKNKLIVFWILG